MSFECINVNYFHIMLNYPNTLKIILRCIGKLPCSPPFLQRETTYLTSDFLSKKVFYKIEIFAPFLQTLFSRITDTT